MNETLKWYDEHARSYADQTMGLSMKYAYDRFLFYAFPDGRILDFGCGSGRDTLFFQSKGYQVTALDGSPKLAEIAAENTGAEVLVMDFNDFQETNAYEGIWACASLVHLDKEQMPKVYANLIRALKKDGILYVSLKNGNGEEIRDGRHYSDYTRATIAPIILSHKNTLLLEFWENSGTKPGQDQKQEWINFIVRKVSM